MAVRNKNASAVSSLKATGVVPVEGRHKISNDTSIYANFVNAETEEDVEFIFRWTTDNGKTLKIHKNELEIEKGIVGNNRYYFYMSKTTGTICYTWEKDIDSRYESVSNYNYIIVCALL